VRLFESAFDGGGGALRGSGLRRADGVGRWNTRGVARGRVCVALGCVAFGCAALGRATGLRGMVPGFDLG
jgi:hypothetical protein